MPAIPIKDYIYAAVILALLVGFGVFVHHERQIGAAHEVTALKKSSDQLTAKAVTHNAAIAQAYTASTAAIVENLNAQLKTASDLHESDSQRLLDFDTYRRQHAAMARTAHAAGTGSQGDSGADADDERIKRLEFVASELADAARVQVAALAACMKDRDDLTGKP